MQNPAWIRLIMQNQTNGRKKKPLKSSQNLPSFLTTNIIKGIRQFFFFTLTLSLFIAFIIPILFQKKNSVISHHPCSFSNTNRCIHQHETPNLVP
jgi:hypothetical protein